MGDQREGPAEEVEDKPKPSLGARIREHLQAAEVAAEESAGYGWATEAVEAVEAAVNPEHELGTKEDEAPPAADQAGDAPAEGERRD